MSLSTFKLEQLRKVITESKHLVCMADLNMQSDNGYPIMQDSDWAYDMEAKYKNAPEEIFNSSYYATRKEQFYKFYRNEVISNEYEPDESYKAFKKLEDKGYLKAIISTGIYSIAVRAGCKNVIELHGNVYNNYCPHCRKTFGIDYIRKSDKVPMCPKCNVVVRPGVFLYGEMVDNQIMTRAMDEISKADVLMLCGGNLTSPNMESNLQFYKGKKLIIINEEKHYSDERAFLVINDKVKNVLPHIFD